MKTLFLLLFSAALLCADPLPLLTITADNGTAMPTFLFQTYADSVLIGRVEIDYGDYQSLVELTVNGGEVAATACDTICDYENVATILAAHSNYTFTFSEYVDSATLFGVYYHDRITGNAYNYPGTVVWSADAPEPGGSGLMLVALVVCGLFAAWRVGK